MSTRPPRGAARGPRGDHTNRGGRGDQHSGSGGGGQHGQGQQSERPKRENILDLGKYVDKRICVKFSGGREVSGLLKGHDPLMNLVLDECSEVLRDPDSGATSSRNLGLLVARGTLLTSIGPSEGMTEIGNPFAAQGEGEGEGEGEGQEG
ncbi:MAG: Sm-like protein lsm7 [Alyxoria varia]|nr:MAG: Sm-like protein lsm7 [Alyxoria varia]